MQCGLRKLPCSVMGAADEVEIDEEPRKVEAGEDDQRKF
jgi:hypothetical protein